jgi:predicted CXXCH cytochrome family protein
MFLITPVLVSINLNIVHAVLPDGDTAISNVKWDSKTGTKATISWTEPFKTGDTVEKYFVEVFDTATPELKIINIDNGSSKTYEVDFSGLTTGTKYTIKIVPSFISEQGIKKDEYSSSKEFYHEFKRPSIDSNFTGVRQNGVTNLFGENLTNVTTSSTVVIRIKDDYALNLIRNDYIEVTDEAGVVGGSITAKEEVDGSDNKSIDLVFTPTGNFWSEGKTYTVTLKNTLKDDAGNLVFPYTFKFTTVKSWVAPAPGSDQENPNPALRSGNPHGAFVRTENACLNCHGSQKALSLKVGKTIQDAANNFCLSCHDGTVASQVSLPNGVLETDSIFTHGKAESHAGLSSANCSDCHDSHLVWTEKNPNSFKSVLAFDHKELGASIMVPGSVPQVAVLKQENCYSCHKDDTGRVKKLASSEAFTGVGFTSYLQPLNYKKMATTTGKKDDMSLCIFCHKDRLNGGTATDIETYIEDGSSGHRITFGDRKNIDGITNLVGNLMCSDCHETHGSKNGYMLKSSLGHENVNGTYTSLASKQSDWTAATERDFCLKCHNDSTKVYGIQATFTARKEHKDNTGTGGINYLNWSCSEIGCHGSGSATERIIKAAHAPIKDPISQP